MGNYWLTLKQGKQYDFTSGIQANHSQLCNKAEVINYQFNYFNAQLH